MVELTFVHQVDGQTPRRRRLMKACDLCRARKKRCVHFGDVNRVDADDDVVQTDGQTVVSPTDPTQIDSGRQSATTVPNEAAAGSVSSSSIRENGQSHGRPASAGTKRFFSDLNPEATFVERDPPSGDGERSATNEIGVWVDRREWDEFIRQRDKNASDSRNVTQLTYQYGMSGDQRPHSTVLGPLIDLYFEKIHPILPIIDENEFRAQYDSTHLFEPMAHAICLVAAKLPDAEPLLKIHQSPSTLPPREFCSRVYASVVGSLKAPCRYDKVTLIRMFALASLHSEGAEGAEESSMLLSQAMHHAQTMGIHLGQQSGAHSEADLSMKRLFWCLWALDRANSTQNGRPVIMSDVDIAIDRFEPGESGYPAFEAWLRITELLNKIIAFYRPHYPTDVTGWEDHMPGLEEIIDEVDGWHLPASIHLTLHLYYLTVAILSHRSRGVKLIPRGTNSALRQRLCAGEVVRLMESEYARELHTLPFIPYAVSLALSVSYQHLRQSQFKHQQEDACEDFRKCTKILQRLRRTWSSADTMAAVASKVQQQLDKAPSLASFRITREAQRKAADKGKETRSPCMPTLNGERTGLLEAVADAETRPVQNGEAAGSSSTTAPPSTAAANLADDFALFDGMDDVFTTYLDPNYPVNLDDLSFLDDVQPHDYNNAGLEGHNRW